jgi:hypothetical protein
MKGKQVLDGQGGANVRVETHDGVGALSQLVGKQEQSASGAQRPFLLPIPTITHADGGVLDGETGKVGLCGGDKVCKDGSVKEAHEDDVRQVWQAREGFQVMHQDCATGDGEERFGHGHGERAEAGAARRAADQNHCFDWHGLKRKSCFIISYLDFMLPVDEIIRGNDIACNPITSIRR